MEPINPNEPVGQDTDNHKPDEAVESEEAMRSNRASSDEMKAVDICHSYYQYREGAIELRERLIALKGRPTRSVRDINPSHVNPALAARFGMELAIYELFRDEVVYWDTECSCWKDFLTYRHQRIANEETSRSRDEEVSFPPYSVLFTEYREYYEKLLEQFDRKHRNLDTSDPKSALGGQRQVLVDRLNSIKHQLNDILDEEEWDAVLTEPTTDDDKETSTAT